MCLMETSGSLFSSSDYSSFVVFSKFFIIKRFLKASLYEVAVAFDAVSFKAPELEFESVELASPPTGKICSENL